MPKPTHNAAKMPEWRSEPNCPETTANSPSIAWRRLPVIFTKVEGVTYSSVMITGNLRQAIEGLFAVVSGQFGSLRHSGIFAALCVGFGIGAAVGAYATKGIPDLALGLPVVALLIVLFRCETGPNEERL